MLREKVKKKGGGKKGQNSLKLQSCHGMLDLTESTLKKKKNLIMDYKLNIIILKYSHC